MKKKPKKPARNRRVTASFEIVANTRSLDEIRRVITSQARTLGISRAKIYKVILAVEEASSNVIRHAYSDGHGKTRKLKPISIEIEMTRRRVKILIQDVGRAFDFSKYPAASVVRLALKKRLRGGYGIHLIKSLVDKYEYVRSDNGENHLRLVKHLSGR